MNMKQLLVLTLAVVFFASCGKKKESAQQAAAPQTADTAAPGPTISSEEAKKKADAEKKAQGTSNQKRSGRGQQADNKNKKDQKNQKGSAGSSGSAGSKDNSPVVAHDLALTGGVSKAGMLFTGSSEDGIITQLLNEEKMNLADVQNKNAILAASIWRMAYLIDNQGQLHLDIELKKGNGLKKVNAKAPYTPGQVVSILANQGTANEIQLQAECLDVNIRQSHCGNLLVTMIENGAVATAVLRQTVADIWFGYEKNAQANEYATLVQFFNNAKNKADSANKVDTAYLNTFEVVNGKSGFKVVVTGKRNQLIGFAADLVVKKNLAAPDSAVDKETQFKDIDLWMGGQVVAKDLTFARSISNARMVQNSTKGKIEIEMTVSSASTGSTNTLILRFTRIPIAAVL